MIQFVTLSNPPPTTLRQILRLYQEAEWWGDSSVGLELVDRIVAGSHCFLVAVLDQQVIGMGRAISDGVSDAYIQDVTVSDEYRHRQIGTQIVSRLIERLVQDGIGWIGLIAEKGSSHFYELMGFKKMNNAFPMLKVIK